jgi:hypothetical protein
MKLSLVSASLHLNWNIGGMLTTISDGGGDGKVEFGIVEVASA